MKKLLALETNPARIVSWRLDGTEKSTVLDIKSGIPDGIWVDQEAQTIYFTVMGQPTGNEVFGNQDGTIESCDFNGGNHKTLVSAGNITTPKQIVGDVVQQVLFFSDREGEALRAVSFNGGDCWELLSRRDDPEEEFERQCVGISVSPDKKYLIWTQKGRAKGGKGRIFRSKLVYNNQIPSLESAPQLILSDLPEPIDLDFGAESGNLYWSDRGAEPDGNSINVGTLSEDGNIINHRVLFRGLKEGIGLAVEEAENTAYVSDLGGFIRSINLTTGQENWSVQQSPTTGICLYEI